MAQPNSNASRTPSVEVSETTDSYKCAVAALDFDNNDVKMTETTAHRSSNVPLSVLIRKVFSQSQRTAASDDDDLELHMNDGEDVDSVSSFHSDVAQEPPKWEKNGSRHPRSKAASDDGLEFRMNDEENVGSDLLFRTSATKELRVRKKEELKHSRNNAAAGVDDDLDSQMNDEEEVGSDLSFHTATKDEKKGLRNSRINATSENDDLESHMDDEDEVGSELSFRTAIKGEKKGLRNSRINAISENYDLEFHMDDEEEVGSDRSFHTAVKYEKKGLRHSQIEATNDDDNDLEFNINDEEDLESDHVFHTTTTEEPPLWKKKRLQKNINNDRTSRFALSKVRNSTDDSLSFDKCRKRAADLMVENAEFPPEVNCVTPQERDTDTTDTLTRIQSKSGGGPRGRLKKRKKLSCDDGDDNESIVSHLNAKHFSIESKRRTRVETSNDKGNTALGDKLVFTPSPMPNQANLYKEYWDTLGSLRSVEGVDFSWIGHQIGRRVQLGRVYFKGFKITNKNCSDEFAVGDEIICHHLGIQKYCITAIFQATKSWEGQWVGMQEIQKRGQPYMELVEMSLLTNKDDQIPVWLLDNVVNIKRVTVSKKSPRHILETRSNDQWPSSLSARWVEYTVFRRKTAKLRQKSVANVNMPLIRDHKSDDDFSISNDSTHEDDSTCEDFDFVDEDFDVVDDGVNDFKNIVSREKPLPKDLHWSHRALQALNLPSYVNLAEPSRTDENPALQFVVHNESIYKKRAFDDQIIKKRNIINKAIGELERENIDVTKGLEQDHSELLKFEELVRMDDPEDTALTPSYFVAELKILQREMNYSKPLTELQIKVCYHLFGRQPTYYKRSNDLFFIAPCGYGKSVCYAMAAVWMKKIVLVIEPLHALIDSQLKEMKSRNIPAERLLTFDEAKRLIRPASGDRLYHLVSEKRGPLILYATPELLLKNEKALTGLKRLAELNILALVVVDEFDFIPESTERYRPECRDLVKLLYKTFSLNVTIMFASATSKEDLFREIVTSMPTRRPLSFYSSSCALPNNHTFAVERKISLLQVANRIMGILKHYQADQATGSIFPRCICYCLTKRHCEILKKFLLTTGGDLVQIGIFCREKEIVDKASRNEDLEEFLRDKSKFSVLCATKALGRGVQIHDVRFVFHAVMPLSLTEYVQATGRAGRDGKKSHCIMFYAESDRTEAERVVMYAQLSDCEKTRVKQDLDAVREYAVEGKRCRFNYLAAATVVHANDGVQHNCSDGMRCDNCQRQNGMYGSCFELKNTTQAVTGLEKVDITDIVRKLLEKNEQQKLNWTKKDARKESVVWDKLIKTMFDLEIDKKKKWLLASLAKTASDGTLRGGQTCLFDFIILYFGRCFISFNAAIESIQNGLSLYIQNYWSPFYPAVSTVNALPIFPTAVVQDVDLPQMPYLVQYELSRLKFCEKRSLDFLKDAIGGFKVDYDAVLDALYAKAKKKRPICMPSGMSIHGSGGFFRGILVELDDRLVLQLQPPEKAVDKRFYRHYGSDRFFEISVPIHLEGGKVVTFMKKEHYIGGRKFTFLHCKKDKGPQTFVFFAEKGVGISLNKIITSEDLRKSQFRPSLNPNLTVAKLFKRMKLCFSKTTATYLLPNRSVHFLSDFCMKGVNEIDGCALASPDAFKAIAAAWKNITGANVTGLTGFQFRLGGFKGTCAMDPGLGEGIVLHFRESMLKFISPQNCRADCKELEANVEIFDTLEINSWDHCPNFESEKATLNQRLLQCLEEAAIKSGKLVQLKSFLANTLDAVIQDVEHLTQGNHTDWIEKLKPCNTRLAENGKLISAKDRDSRFVFKLASGNVDLNEPEFFRRRKRIVENMFLSMRKKCHYPVSDCAYLRMYPDHTLLLEEGEAFVALKYVSDTDSGDILAFRSPSYFPGDLRRLKLVSLIELEARCTKEEISLEPDSPVLRRSPKEKIDFFKTMKNAVILSIRGEKSEADRMSGGDYDGDTAWVCWNKDLIEAMPSVIEAESSERRRVSESELGLKNAWTADVQDLIHYALQSRQNAKRLGELAMAHDKCIERYGFEDSRTREVGRAAFIQVDGPDKPADLEGGISLKNLMSLPQPHWKEDRHKQKSDEETRETLSSWLWTEMTKRLEIGFGEDLQEDLFRLPLSLRSLLQKAKDHYKVQQLRDEMSCALKNYLKFKQTWNSLSCQEGQAEPGDKESNKMQYFDKLQEYCAKQREVLIEAKASDATSDCSKLAAVILYDECRLEEFKNTGKKGHSNKAIQFAWLVAEKELINLFNPEALIVSPLVEKSVTGYTCKRKQSSKS